MGQIIERIDVSKYLDYAGVDPVVTRQEALSVTKAIQTDMLSDMKAHLEEGRVTASQWAREYLLRVSSGIKSAEDDGEWKDLGEVLIETGTFILKGNLRKKSDVRNNFGDIVSALGYVGLGLAVLEK